MRDDFWLAVSRFMRELEVRSSRGRTAPLVDLFDRSTPAGCSPSSAGRYGRLPEPPAALGPEQERFLDDAVSGLAEDGQGGLACGLALFAEMTKAKPWDPRTLRATGGPGGRRGLPRGGARRRGAPPGHRVHQEAARAVLRALLPEAGTDIKGHMGSHGELLAPPATPSARSSSASCSASWTASCA